MYQSVGIVIDSHVITTLAQTFLLALALNASLREKSSSRWSIPHGMCQSVGIVSDSHASITFRYSRFPVSVDSVVVHRHCISFLAAFGRHRATRTAVAPQTDRSQVKHTANMSPMG